MHNIHLDTQAKPDLSNDTDQKKTCENGQPDLSIGVPTEMWRALQIAHPAIEAKAEKTGLEAWDDVSSIEENVFTPTHYAPDGGIECIDVMVQQYGLQRVKDWAEITSFKYQWRNGNKIGNSSTQDKMKSIWYTRFSIGDDPRK